MTPCAFDDQAARFVRAPTQSDPLALARLVAFADFPPGAYLFDAGCGPGLVAEAFLEAGHRVYGVDLSPEMVRRARVRCARFGERARFDHGAVQDLDGDPFDGAVSRFVVHHALDPLAFLVAQVIRVRPGGVVLVCDHTTDPAPEAAQWHQEVERGRDRTHARNLTPGELVDLAARAGLEQLRMAEEPFELDFDEWFDRGTPSAAKVDLARLLLAGRARGCNPIPRSEGGISIRCFRSLVRGVKPG